MTEQPETDEQRADRLETERAHAEGEHAFCGVTCEAEMPSDMLRNFILAKGYPGTAGALDELLRRAALTAPTDQPTSDSLRKQYAAAIRPNMLMGLQDAELDGPGGTQRINEWVDWIAKELADVRDREMEQLRARVTELEQQLADADGELTEAREHNDRTCEAVAARDQAEAAIERVLEALEAAKSRGATGMQFYTAGIAALDEPQQPTTTNCVHPEGYEDECPCPPSCICCQPTTTEA